MTTEIVKAFHFDAAHFLPTAPEGHPYRRMHGHSFAVEVTVAGTPDPEQGWIIDFARIEARVAALRDRLDHRLLNEIEGLGLPTLERLAEWIYRALAPDLPGLAAITVRRQSNGEACLYRP
jgi:6-pyruvoyltetrahydropterin/6-carboxytetrahydropterin synthase